MRRDIEADNVVDVVRPFVWIAALFFTAGFCGYLTLSGL
jgi:hypothetical protein